MSIARATGSLFRKGGLTKGLKYLGDKLNFFGRAGEEFTMGATGRATRGPREIISAGSPQRTVQQVATGGLGQPNRTTTATIPAVQGVFGERSLNSRGLAGQIGGNVVGLGGVGTLGYKMFGGSEDAPATDSNGVKNPNYDEERAKFVSKFQQDYLGGSKTMSKSKYDLMAKNSQWVKTAIDNMGMENYNKIRSAITSGQLKNTEEIHRMFTNALAESGDEEALKMAATQPYVLPGIARNKDGNARFIAISPMKQKGGKTSYAHLMLKIDEIPDEDQQQ